MSITYSDCVFLALGIHHTMRMRHIVICGLFRFYNIFSTLSKKWHGFVKKVIEHKMCVLIFPTDLSEIFFILRRTERDMFKDTYWYSCREKVK
jgi:hypothetical protein